MIVLMQGDVVELLSMAECIEVMGSTLAALARGESLLPLRTVVRLPNDKDFFAVMPAYVGMPASMGAKVITVFNDNHGTELDSHQGAVLLFDVKNGSLCAVLDATAITAIRTAAVSALATKHLARPDADDLAILGSGVQARSHLEAIPCVRPIKRVRIWSRTRAHAQQLADAHRGRFQSISVHDDAESAVRGASIICTVTSSNEPVLLGGWLAAGTHVNAVGVSQPKAREIDTEVVTRASLFVDRRDSALKEPGDILQPLSEGAITPEHIRAEIGEVVAGKKPGRRSTDEITLFKSLGLAVEDIAAAQHVYVKALERNIGTRVNLGGMRR
jgi:ornithine cyclodeaminase/alanine dehydrogenase-like protein (mu-crystallin family)